MTVSMYFKHFLERVHVFFVFLLYLVNHDFKINKPCLWRQEGDQSTLQSCRSLQSLSLVRGDHRVGDWMEIGVSKFNGKNNVFYRVLRKTTMITFEQLEILCMTKICQFS